MQNTDIFFSIPFQRNGWLNHPLYQDPHRECNTFFGTSPAFSDFFTSRPGQLHAGIEESDVKEGCVGVSSNGKTPSGGTTTTTWLMGENTTRFFVRRTSATRPIKIATGARVAEGV